MSDETGTFRKYVSRNFGPAALQTIAKANEIIAEYERQGFVLTLRQLYYQFVSRDLLPNKQESYNKLGTLVSDGRLAGLISWTAIEDRTRNLQGLGYYSGIDDAVRRVRNSYRLNLWENQPYCPEVWIEKEALVGVIERICNNLRVDFFACRGYNSQSEQWRAGRRFAARVQRGQRPIVFHLGDHDPSGIDMTRDNAERLSMFADTPIQVVRLALNMAQIEQFKPPPNPAKMTDSRFEGYRAQYGENSWELDALDPTIISAMIENAVRAVRNEELFAEALRDENRDKERLDAFIANME